MLVPVSTRAIVARLNRCEGFKIHLSRPGTQARARLGKFYIVENGKAQGVLLAKYARELGVLKQYEEIV